MTPWRILAPALVTVLGAAAGAMAVGFVVRFPTDPLGPRALPWLAAGLMCLAGATALVQGVREWHRRADSGAASEESPLPAPGSPPAFRAPGAVLIFLGFALLLEPAGYLAATTLAFAGLARLFGGRFVHGMAAGLAFALLTFLLFVQVLGLALPLGVLVDRLGG